MFPEEPAGGEGTVFVPVNSTTTFRCSVAVGYTVSWQVRRLGAQSSVPITVSTAQFELTISNRSSTLTVHGITEELNQAHVLCVATEEDNFLSTEDRGVLVIVYGTYVVSLHGPKEIMVMHFIMHRSSSLPNTTGS